MNNVGLVVANFQFGLLIKNSNRPISLLIKFLLSSGLKRFLVVFMSFVLAFIECLLSSVASMKDFKDMVRVFFMK